MSLQALVQNDGGAYVFEAGSPVQVHLPADALRVLAPGDSSVAEIREETFGDVSPALA